MRGRQSYPRHKASSKGVISIYQGDAAATIWRVNDHREQKVSTYINPRLLSLCVMMYYTCVEERQINHHKLQTIKSQDNKMEESLSKKPHNNKTWL